MTGHVPNGALLLIFFCGAMSAISSIGLLAEDLRYSRSWSEAAMSALGSVAAYPMVFLVLFFLLCFAGGLYLVGWTTYTFLHFGYWAWPSGFGVLRVLDVPEVAYSGWAGFDALATGLLAQPAALLLLAGAPIAALITLVAWVRLVAFGFGLFRPN